MWVMSLAALQHVIHQVLNLDDQVDQAFAPLNGKSLQASLANTPLAVRISFEGSRPYLEPAGAPADVSVSGDFEALIKLGRDLAAGQGAMVLDGIHVDGSVGVLKSLSDAFAQLSIDPEFELSKRLGDPMASALIGGLKAIIKPFRQASEQAKRQSMDFLKHEQDWVAKKADLEQLSDQSRALRHRLDRLERRLMSLEKPHS